MRRFVRSAGGQSAVEAALALPILLLLVLGIADLGRFGYYAISVSQATRNAAAYAAMNPLAVDLDSRLQDRVCEEMRLGTGCGVVPVVSRNASLETTVTVTYEFSLITASIAQPVGMGTIPLTATATFPGHTQ